MKTKIPVPKKSIWHVACELCLTVPAETYLPSDTGRRFVRDDYPGDSTDCDDNPICFSFEVLALDERAANRKARLRLKRHFGKLASDCTWTVKRTCFFGKSGRALWKDAA